MIQNSEQGPLAGKRFFIDPKVDKTTSIKVKEKLILLGGKVDEFLDKGIHFALTSETIVGRHKKARGRGRSPLKSPFSNTSPCVDQGFNMTQRWKDLAKQASSKTQSSNIVDVAKSFGIKIRLIDDVLSWLNKKTENLPASATASSSGTIIPPVQPNNIRLKSPCVKVEDFYRSIKPIYEEFEVFASMDFSTQGNKCPIISAQAQKPKSLNKKNLEKKGFCECCQCSYLNDRKHRKTAEHLAFGETNSHFENLDHYISEKKLDLNQFLKRFSSNSSDSSCMAASMDISNEEKSQKDSTIEATKSGAVISKYVACMGFRRSPRKLAGKEESIISSKSNSSRTITYNRSSRDDNDIRPNAHLLLNSPSKIQVKDNTILMEKLIKSKPLRTNNSPVTTIHSTPTKKDSNPPSVCNRISSSADLVENSPLSRLRSYKRKLEKTDSSCNTRPVESKKALKKDTETSSPVDDVLRLLQSSVNDSLKSEFFGF